MSEQITPKEGEEQPNVAEQISDLRQSFDEKFAKQDKAFAAMRVKNKQLEVENQDLRIKPVEKKETQEEDPKDDKAYLKKMGFMTKDDFEADKMQKDTESRKKMESEAINEFLEKNPDCDDDVKWSKITSIYQNDYGVSPKTKSGYMKILASIKKDLDGDVDIEDIKKNVAGEMRAEAQTNSRLSLGGSGSSKRETSNPMDKRVDAILAKNKARGGNLTREQVEKQIKTTEDLLK